MKYLIGIDEVGRGCLAGPVTVAAVAIAANTKFQKTSSKLKDSKQLTAKQREEWFEYAREHPKIFYARANVYPKIIDRINISQAANLAATRALNKLVTRDQRLVEAKVKVLLDGGLFLNTNSLVPSRFVRTIVRGDEKINAIKLASIVAKVGRDRIMKRNHKKFPVYGFDRHVGYGTRVHIRAIKKHGPSEIHRLTYIKNFYRI